MTNGIGGLALRALALAAAVVLPVAFALDPLDGDLTRLGGFSENRYGPAAPQAIFVPPLVETARPGESYDVVVIGDGFSLPDPSDGRAPFGQYWTDHLRNLTGLTIGVRHLDELSAADYLATDDFRERPPRVLVYETVERKLIERTDSLPPHAGRALKPDIGTTIARPLDRVPQPRPRPKAHAWAAPPVGQAIGILSKALPRLLLDRPIGPVEERHLAYAGLFSSAVSTSTLFLAEDFEPWRADRALLEERRAALRDLQTAVEANGQTRFLVMVAPDKGTVYADFLMGTPPVRSAVEEVLGADPQLNYVPLAAGLRALAAGGITDLYKPNDSRWGTQGHVQVARTVYATLGRMGIITVLPSPNVATLPCTPGYPDCAPFQVRTD